MFYHWFTQYLNSFIGIIKNKNCVPRVLSKKVNVKCKKIKTFSLWEKFVKEKKDMCLFVFTTKTSYLFAS
ncbi:MAG: hypothetical protein COW71_03095 [Ignavibacteriales bacterium CG18_big_fil_WC_8_21_14_2_50_31_20]|nr:MAG: hypothetical protein COW71_03095 [Ignavibacteriales bacterium CG18_big_fil_WC_8_21_14_2_50_31_20]